LRITIGTLGTGGSWYWYSGSCGGTFLSNGTVLGVSPTVTTDYYLRGKGICDTSACITKQIYVIPGYELSGTVWYYHTVIPLDSVKLYLKDTLGNIVDSTQSDLAGNYQFNTVKSGRYTILSTTHKPWGGVNSTDAVKVKRHFAGSEFFTTSLRLHAADVNLSYGINVTDAVKITRRFVGSDTLFARGDWLFERPFGGDTINVSPTLNDTIIVNGNNVIQDFKGLCVGDVNSSNVPLTGAKSKPMIKLDYFDYHDFKRLNSNDLFELPIFATNDLNVGAISMILKFPKELVTIDNLQLIIDNEKLRMNNDDDNLVYNVIGDELRIGWYESERALNYKSGEPVLIISGKTTNNFKSGDVIKFSIANNPLCEFADEEGNPIDNVVLKSYSIGYSSGQNIGSIENDLSNDMFIFPNPAGNTVNIMYNIANDGFVKISMYNVLGEKIIDVVNKTVLKGFYNTEIDLSTISPGVYTFKMVSNDKNVNVKKLVVSK
jgi:hypothetical protein